MPLPIVAGAGLGAVITAALGAVVAKVFEMLIKFFAYKVARNLAVGVGAVLLAGSLTVGMAQGIKAVVLAGRMFMPDFIAMATFFLPSSINWMIAAYVNVHLLHFIWQWSMKNLARYTRQTF